MYNLSESCNVGLGRIKLTMTVVMTFSFVSFCFPALLLIQYAIFYTVYVFVSWWYYNSLINQREIL